MEEEMRTSACCREGDVRDTKFWVRLNKDKRVWNSGEIFLFRIKRRRDKIRKRSRGDILINCFKRTPKKFSCKEKARK
jgi:hypothetical protein